MTLLPHQLAPDGLQRLQYSQTTVFRLGSATDRWVEYYDGTVLISAPTSRDFTELLTLSRSLCEKLQLPVKGHYGRILSKSPDGKTAPVLLEGRPLETPLFTVRENGLNYQIDFSAGYSTGLFPDQRQNRLHLTAAQPARVLNCFAYTCAFSVAAARAGAETLSIDVAAKALDWGRKNFELNGLNPNTHRFRADDVRDCLPRLARRGEHFDAIILDPPTFARSHKGKPFQVEKEMPDLVRMALDCLAPHGLLLISTNCRQLDPGSLQDIARTALARSRRTGRLHTEPPPVDFPPWAMPSTLWITC